MSKKTNFTGADFSQLRKLDSNIPRVQTMLDRAVRSSHLPREKAQALANEIMQRMLGMQARKQEAEAEIARIEEEIVAMRNEAVHQGLITFQ